MKRTFAVAAAATALATACAAIPAQAADDDPFDKVAPRQAPSQLSERLGSEAGTSAGTAVYRLAGDTRITTAIAASQDRWGDFGTEFAAGAVVLSRSDAYADALGGSALAGAAQAPLLLTPGASLAPEVEAEIVRLLGPAESAGPVYVLGGPTAVSTQVTDRLGTGSDTIEGLGYQVVRLQGLDRFETSVAIAKQTAALIPDGVPQLVFATTGRNFPDGLTAGATAGGYWSTLVLTRDTSVPPSVATYVNEMRGLDIPLFTVGGQAAAAFTGDYELVGTDRYHTARKVANLFWGDPATRGGEPIIVGLATGVNWPDALSGGAHVAGGGPLLLTQTDSIPTATATAVSTMVSAVDTNPIEWGVVFGGQVAVTDKVVGEFDALLNQ
ncbi:cell wall-binding repeat-containing protein [Intrasporangium calvum]|uniref:Cell wall-binding repeat-containing protein n=1 Tax=Intrasporangium calvum TaxID=53358 RepID=A0ABT5GEB7_9MICO|nr:cell wall-binding repeat-containing protein [Intrasporangium calvum]MDC5696592.1 cell wall-binding repeat-containing protein [Intrasporangium calvum]